MFWDLKKTRTIIVNFDFLFEWMEKKGMNASLNEYWTVIVSSVEIITSCASSLNDDIRTATACTTALYGCLPEKRTLALCICWLVGELKFIYISIYISSSKKLTSSTSFTTVPHLNCPTFFFYCCWSFDIFIQMYASTFCFCAECLHLSQFIGYHDYAAKYSAVVKFVGFRLAFIQCFRKNQTDQFEAASSARYIRLFVEEPSFWTYWSLGLTAQISLYQPTVLQLPVECSAVPYRHPNRLLLLPIIKWIMARDPS